MLSHGTSTPYSGPATTDFNFNLTLYLLGLFEGLSSSHTHMKTLSENTRLVHTTSNFEGVNIYRMDHRA